MGRPLAMITRGDLFRLFPINPRQIMGLIDDQHTMAVVVYEGESGERRAIPISPLGKITSIEDAAAGQLRNLDTGEVLLPVKVYRKNA